MSIAVSPATKNENAMNSLLGTLYFDFKKTAKNQPNKTTPKVNTQSSALMFAITSSPDEPAGKSTLERPLYGVDSTHLIFSKAAVATG
jgi:hypothetical protein